LLETVAAQQVTPEQALHRYRKLAQQAADSTATPATPATPEISTPPATPATPTIQPAPTLQAEPTPAREPIAVIGMAGQFPGADDVRMFWDNLAAGRCTVTTPPAGRWDAENHPDPLVRRYRWGGFLQHPDRFDPLFFNLSPKEAELTDPQQRLFMQEAWKAFEDAGYTRARLDGAACGVFVGCSGGDYDRLLEANGVAVDAHTFIGNSDAILPARMAFFLNLKGPSVVIDTACSSSLTAIQTACESLWSGGCEVALTGGVSVLNTPAFYRSAAAAGMLSPAGLCKTFDDSADGFVPGEGVGCVVLKPLSAARRDRDRIYALIRGVAVNQDGKSNGITAPSATSQTALERAVYRRFGIDPASIGYIEAHGTGTKLGDPIEVSALTDAFRQYTDRRGFCAIGSVKANIGHALAAAGIAGFIKLLLCLKHRKLPPAVHFQRENRHIDFAASPFYVNTELRDWAAPTGQPRRAAISSFGFSGTNCHVVIEQAPTLEMPAERDAKPLYFLPVSAKTEDALAQRLADLHAWFAAGQGGELADIAYTLQARRTRFPVRAALLVRSREDLAATLATIQGGGKVEKFLRGSTTNAANDQSTAALIHDLHAAAQAGDVEAYGNSLWALAQRYVDGAAIDWETLDPDQTAVLVDLPAYPFARKRYWVTSSLPSPAEQTVAWLHPLLERNISDLREQRYAATFSGEEFYLRDHRINDTPVLPGVAMLEMARAAAELAQPTPVTLLRGIAWSVPAVASDGPLDLHLALQPAGDEVIHFELRPAAGDGVHCRGQLALAAVMPLPVPDLAAIKCRCREPRTGADLYRAYAERGLRYGSTFQAIAECWTGTGEALARWVLPAAAMADAQAFRWHPSLLDAVLQTVGALLAESHPDGLYIPFAIDRLYLPTALPHAGYAHATASTHGQALKFDIALLDDAGQPVGQIESLTLRPYAAKAQTAVGWFGYRWELESVGRKSAAHPATVLILAQQPDLIDDLAARLAPVPVIGVTPGESFHRIDERRYTLDPTQPEDYRRLLEQLPAAVSLSHVLVIAPENIDEFVDPSAALQPLLCLAQALIAARRPLALLYAYADKTTATATALHAAVGGFARTLRLEHPAFGCTTLALDDALNRADWIDILARELAAILNADLRYDHQHRRYRRRLAELPAPSAGTLPLRQNGVYLITGGLGGLGAIFARHLAEQKQARLVLAGRSPADAETQSQLQALAELGAEAIYLQTDITQQAEVDALIATAKQRFGALHGVLHSAGVLHDGLLPGKTKSDLDAVLAPKIRGAVLLDQATRAEPLDCFILFSSTAAVTGNVGQADYAYANAFLDHFAQQRETLRAQGQRQGKTLSIGWPFWRAGGMAIDASKAALLRRAVGLEPLETAEGLAAFAQALSLDASHVMLFKGDSRRLLASLEDSAQSSQPDMAKSTPVLEPNAGAERLLDAVLAAVSAVLKIDPADLDPATDLPEYGFDSISFTELANALNKKLKLDLTPALFFEYPSVDTLVEHLQAEYRDRLADWLTPVPESTAPVTIAEEQPRWRLTDVAPPAWQQSAPVESRPAEPLAIIGMSGVMPQSPDLDTFWRHLEQGADLISEIPPERWDWRAIHGDPHGSENRTDIKWGGFMPDVDQFDPLFFGLSPKEAECMDPQQRLFLETVWKTIEDAGYRPSALAGSRTGVFVGVSTADYIELYDKDALGIEAQTATGMANSLTANRVSYLLGLHGPSEPIDTACSSALVALHRAAQAIHGGDCDQAIVGGVNAILTPTLHISFSKAGMLSRDGRCRAFDKDANGYVRGEGVGAILIKPLSQARADGDHIYALIRSTAVNHGGSANSLTAPNPNAQAELIAHACERAGIDPATISYIETHGTGTALGDPVEINGLKKAFAQLYQAKNQPLPTAKHCALGSVKTNIGHLETAAGIAGVLKLLLALRHGKLPGNAHFRELNPYIRLDDSPFYVLQDSQPWAPSTDASGQPLPRRAGISSFGFGGANAHAILEEYPQAVATAATAGPHLFVLSAKAEDRLREAARRLAEFVEKQQPDLTRLAYTLQTGREALDCRVAVIAVGHAELQEKLARFVACEPKIAGVWAGHVDAGGDYVDLLTDGEEGAEFLRIAIAQRKFDKLARLWIAGVAIDWRPFYGDRPPQRLPLPTYPFARERYWVPVAPKRVPRGDRAPLFELDLTRSLGTGLTYKIPLRANDPLVRDHLVRGRAMLPGAGALALAAAVVDRTAGRRMTQVVWPQPALVDDKRDFYLVLHQDADTIRFQLVSAAAGDTVQHASAVLHPAAPTHASDVLDISAIQARCDEQRDQATIYTAFAQSGLDYGESYRVLRRIWGNSREALGELVLPSSWTDAWPLSPALLDGALQTAAGIVGQSGRLRIPFAVAEIELLGDLPTSCYAYVEVIGENRYRITLAAVDGRICARMNDLVARPLKDSTVSLFYAPRWVVADMAPTAAPTGAVACVYPPSAQALTEAIGARCLGNDFYSLRLGTTTRAEAADRWEIDITDPAAWTQVIGTLPTLAAVYFLGGIQASSPALTAESLDNAQEQGVITLFRLLKALVRHDYRQRALNICVVTDGIYPLAPDETGLPHAAALAGFIKSAAREYPNWAWRAVDLPADDPAAVEAIVKAPETAGEMLAWRAGCFYRRRLRPVEIPAATAPFRTGGVYCILGGAGGIGLTLSRHLAERFQAKLVLIGRSPLTEAQQRQIDALATLGGDALYLQADAADFDALQQAVAAAKARFGAIHGAIHSAIVLADKTLDNLDETALRTVLAPKTIGALNFYRALADEALDFMAFFSSAQSFTGNAGQANYAAACTFEDAFAATLAQQAPYSVTTINWGYWGEVGIVADADYRARLAAQGIGAIEPTAGIDGLTRLLASPLRQALMIAAEASTLEAMGADLEQRGFIQSQFAPPFLPALRERLHSLDRRDNAMLERLRQADAAAQEYSHLRLLGQLQDVLQLASKAAWCERLQLVPRYDRLFDAMLDMLARAGWIRVAGDHIETTLTAQNIAERVAQLPALRVRTLERFPELAAHLNLLDACLESLPAILNGSVAATDVVFPNGSTVLVEGIYRGNAIADQLNQLTAQSVAAYVEKRLIAAPDATLRIVEIGAGTGGTSAPVLAALERYGARLRYVYTDISPAFLQHGERHFSARYPFVDYQLLDIERDPEAQGLAAGTVDLVLAANVLHATRDIERTLRHVKQLLTGHGALVLNETTVRTDLATLTFGLLDGWWLFEDGTRRLPYAPLLSAAMWRRQLWLQGFTALTLGPDGQIVIAQSDGVATRVEEKPEKSAPPLPAATPVPTPTPTTDTASAPAAATLDTYARSTVLAQLAACLRIAPEKIQAERQFSEYGVDSVLGIELTNRLNKTLDIGLKTTVLFDYPNLAALTDHLVADHATALTAAWQRQQPAPAIKAPSPPASSVAPVAPMPTVQPAAPAVSTVSTTTTEHVASSPAMDRAVAVIGMAGRFGDADDVAQYWMNLSQGKSSIVEAPAERWDAQALYDPDPEVTDKTYCKYGGFLNNVDGFDAPFFNLSAHEARLADPQQRLFLETCWTALEDAGYAGKAIAGRHCAVFVGAGPSEYLDHATPDAEVSPQAMLGNISSILAARISYLLDLKGPSVALDTACSASLAAVHLACQSVLSGESELALAGGVYLTLTPKFHIQGSNARMLSPEGLCKTFDDGADGFVPGEAVGAVVLKPLAQAVADGDHIYGVIRGSGMNQDGATNGITAPSSRAQTELELAVYRRAGIDPATIGYVEAHGTATKLGDPVEIEALTRAFAQYTDRKEFCGIGSVKTNIGHTVTAAGVASLIKVLLALKHRQMPPSLNYTESNRHIDFAASPFFVNTELRDWTAPDGQPRRAAISSFGISGSNVHLVVEEYPTPSRATQAAAEPVLFTLSARDQAQLRQYAERFGQWLARAEALPTLADIAFTLQVGRPALRTRLALVVDDLSELGTALRTFAQNGTADGVYCAQADANPSTNAELQRWLEQRDLASLAQAWTAGAEIDWSLLHAGQSRQRVSLPTYPFARKRYWIPEHQQTPAPFAARLGVPPAVSAPTVVADATNESTNVAPESTDLAQCGAWLGTLAERAPAPAAEDMRAYEELDAFCPLFLLNVLQTMGVFRRPDELHHQRQLRNSLGIADAHLRLFDACLDMLARAGFIVLQGDRIRTQARLGDPELRQDLADLERRRAELAARYPAIVPCLDLLWVCLPHYPAMLSGQRPATEILLPDGDLELVERIYKGNSVTNHLNGLVAELIGWYANQRLRAGDSTPLQVLEVGAGTGGASAGVLAALASFGTQVEYLYTDISPAFLHHGRQAFGQRYPFVQFRLLDVERDGPSQGYDPASIDLVLANNVIHATHRLDRTLGHLQALLKPGGWLVLSEVTRLSDFLTLTFGLLPGWWLFEDSERRIPHAPLLSPAGWRKTLPECGLDQVTILGPQQQVIVAQNVAAVANVATPSAPEITAPPTVAVSTTTPATSPTSPNIPASVDKQSRRRVEQSIKTCLAAVLGDEEQRFDSTAAFMEFGVDSLLAVSIVKQINTDLNIQLRSTDLFNYPSIRVLTDHIVQRFPDSLSAASSVAAPVEPVTVAAPAPALESTATTSDAPRPTSDAESFDIAVIGMSGQFPQAPDIATFWANLTAGRDCITETPSQRWDIRQHPDPVVRTYRWGGFLDSADQFDPLFFNISPLEARYMDPQQRLFLQEAWRAFEDAGYAPTALAEQRCGVFVGCSGGDYSQRAPASGDNASLLFTGNIASILAGRVAYFLNLRGPSVAIDTACSSSLVALDAACRSLWTGGCEMALVGGVAVLSTPIFHLSTGASGMLSPDGRCKTFDASANGFVPGEAAAAVVLKPLAAAERDGDHIYGVIKASGVNQDGRSNGITAPSAASQTALEQDIYQRFGIHPETLGYIEAHGTGTQLGDPIEVSALTDAFRASTDRRRFCALGSVKSNVGHTLTAAGVVGLIKALLCLQHRQLVPSLHYRQGNDHIALADSPFYVNTEWRDWSIEPGQRRRAAVSSFGLSGTNAHAILEEYPQSPPPAAPAESQLILLSARDDARLQEYARNLARYLAQGVGTGREPVLSQVLGEAAALLAVPVDSVDAEAELSEYGLDDPVRLVALVERLRERGIVLELAQAQRCATLDEIAAAILPAATATGTEDDAATLAQIAYTLQTGRAALDERLAIVATTRAELADKLNRFLAGETVAGVYRGDARSAAAAALLEDDSEALLQRLLGERKLERLARLWCAGAEIDWDGLYPTSRPRRMSLPTYPFARQSYWLEATPAPTAATLLTVVPNPTPAQDQETAPAVGTVDDVADRTDYIETRIRNALAAVLQIDPAECAADRGFEEFGVNSILAVSLAERVGTELGVRLRATEFFNYGTIRKLTDYIDDTFGADIQFVESANVTPTATETDADGAVLALFRQLENGELGAEQAYRQLEGL